MKNLLGQNKLSFRRTGLRKKISTGQGLQEYQDGKLPFIVKSLMGPMETIPFHLNEK